VREALAALKSARSESGGDLTLEEMLAVIRREAPARKTGGGDITSIDQLAAAVGVGEDVHESDELETSPAGSWKWRDVGRLALG
jgi:hypothetical protein